MRDLYNIPAEPNIIDLKFKKDYSTLQAKWKDKYNWLFFRELASKDKYNLQNIRIPSTNSQEEFDTLVLALVKCIIDSLNEEMLIINTPIDDKGNKIRGITKSSESCQFCFTVMLVKMETLKTTARISFIDFFIQK